MATSYPFLLSNISFREPMMLYFVLGCILLWLASIAWKQPRAVDNAAHWHQTVEGLHEPADQFFAQVYQALQAGMEGKQIALTRMGFGPTFLFETRSVLSERPLYLEARYKKLRYYVYVGQTPAGLYLSTWFYSPHLTGGEGTARTTLANLNMLQLTPFEFDAALMFNEALHGIVLQVLDSYIMEQGLEPIEGMERRPVYHQFYHNARPASGRHTSQASIPVTLLPMPGSGQGQGYAVNGHAPNSYVPRTPHLNGGTASPIEVGPSVEVAAPTS